MVGSYVSSSTGLGPLGRLDSGSLTGKFDRAYCSPSQGGCPAVRSHGTPLRGGEAQTVAWDTAGAGSGVPGPVPGEVIDSQALGHPGASGKLQKS